jgi:hypothetical protein
VAILAARSEARLFRQAIDANKAVGGRYESPGGGSVPISPELALVDPQLRTEAIRAMPYLEPFGFLVVPAAVEAIGPLPPGSVAAGARPPLRLVLAALVYLLGAAARFTVSGFVLVIVIAALVAILAFIA